MELKAFQCEKLEKSGDWKIGFRVFSNTIGMDIQLRLSSKSDEFFLESAICSSGFPVKPLFTNLPVILDKIKQIVKELDNMKKKKGR
ncbi:MAG: hypothetical protein ACTSPG_10275 [Candidatus Hodarchaeales archaeon]